MIIIGDIASPTQAHSEILGVFFEEHNDIFQKTVICNLEGLISDNHTVNETTPLLYNHPSVVNSLNKGNISICALANNHTLDLPSYFDSTITHLKKSKISVIGAGSTKYKILPELEFFEDGHKVYLFNFCWDFLLYHQQNPVDGVYVSTLDELKLIERVKQLKLQNSNVKVVIYFHWSFDLEILPFPSYRLFSKDLIDAGANLIVGCHSHCIQGGEIYKDGLIVYGIGNFFIPWDTYVNGKMGYPEFSKFELGVEWNLDTNQFALHWFEIEGKNLETKIIYKGKTTVFDNRFKKYADPFSLTDKDYVSHFKKNRRKRFLIPVFKKYLGTKYFLEILFLKKRAKFARLLAKYNFRKWNN